MRKRAIACYTIPSTPGSQKESGDYAAVSPFCGVLSVAGATARARGPGHTAGEIQTVKRHGDKPVRALFHGRAGPGHRPQGRMIPATLSARAAV